MLPRMAYNKMTKDKFKTKSKKQPGNTYSQHSLARIALAKIAHEKIASN